MPPQPLAQRIDALKPTAVNQVLHEVRQLQAQGRSLISLMRGQPDTPTPQHIVEAAQKALRDGLTGYPDNRGEPILRRAVAEKLQRDQGLIYDPDREILITDGATAGIVTALGAILEPGENVLVPDPIYDAYASPISLWGGRVKPVNSRIHDGRFALETSLMDFACTPRSKALLLNTPWNPTGTVFTKAELTKCMQVAERADLYVISDEIYENLIYDDRKHISPAALSDDAKQRTIIVNSLSKTYAMTGWRVGYCAGPAKVIDAMFLLLQQSSRGPATFVQHAAAAALRGDQAWVQSMRTEYQQRRDRVVRALSGLPSLNLADATKLLPITPLVPEGGLFVMLDVRGLGMPSDQIRVRLLHDAGVVVIHGSAYGPGGEGTLRVSFAGGADLDEGLMRLRDGLERLASLGTM